MAHVFIMPLMLPTCFPIYSSLIWSSKYLMISTNYRDFHYATIARLLFLPPPRSRTSSMYVLPLGSETKVLNSKLILYVMSLVFFLIWISSLKTLLGSWILHCTALHFALIWVTTNLRFTGSTRTTRKIQVTWFLASEFIGALTLA